MKNVKDFQTIKTGDIVLFFDSENGKIRGFDKILSKKSNGDYEYLTTNGQKYRGNLIDLLSQYSAYIVNDSYLQYSDELFSDSVLTWDYGYVFIDVLNRDNLLAKSLWNLLVEKARKNIEFRIKFMDLTEKYKYEIHLMSFLDTENHVSDVFKNQLNQEMISLILD